MTRAVLIRVVATVVVVVFAAASLLAGLGTPGLGWLDLFSIAVLIASGLVWLWEVFLWKLQVVQQFGLVPLDVSGTWQGTLASLWKDAQTGASPAPRTAYLVVRQTASSVSAVLLTDESKSVSSLAAVSTALDSPALNYLYLNRPDPRFEDRSRMHHGSSSLDISGRPATRLRGRYWTDRDSRGELDFTQRNKHAADDYAQASSLFAPPKSLKQRHRTPHH